MRLDSCHRLYRTARETEPGNVRIAFSIAQHHVQMRQTEVSPSCHLDARPIVAAMAACSALDKQLTQLCDHKPLTSHARGGSLS